MIILNSLKLLSQLSKIEDEIAKIEKLMKEHYGETEGERLLGKLFGQHRDAAEEKK
jgi:hypothetical protein